jgi:hypothetical protein
VLARLIEAWTDSVSERAYQATFCHMLIHRGHRILHNTRHGALEFGKDIVTVDAEGVPCAFQLKGHPGNRLRKREYAELLPQIDELVRQPILYPGAPRKRHRAFLVTNGEVEEEVQVAVAALSNSLTTSASRSLELISRGTFISWALDLEDSLWPTHVDDLACLFSLLAESGSGFVSLERLDRLLRPILGLTDTPQDKAPSSAEIERRIASESLMMPVALRAYALKNNHWALATGWCSCAAYAIAASERFQVRSARINQFIDLAEQAGMAALRELAAELVDARHVGPRRFAEIPYFKTRHTLLCGVLALVWFLEQSENSSSDLCRSISRYLREHAAKAELWGEAAVPQMLMTCWCLAEIDPSPRADGMLARLLQDVIERSLNRRSQPMYGVHYDAEAVLTHRHADLLRPVDDPLEGEDEHPASFFAEGLLQIAARRNLKCTCKATWKAYSHVLLRRFSPKESWQSLVYRTEQGALYESHPPKRKAWPDLVTEAHAPSLEVAPDLRNRPFLLALFALVFPHRASTALIRELASNFDSSWTQGPGRLAHR